MSLKVLFNQNVKYVRAFIDGGAQRSFISPRLVKTLNLQVVKKINFPFRAFGGEPNFQTFDVVKIRLFLNNRYTNLNLLVHEGVDTTIHNPGIFDASQHLINNGYTVADKFIDSDYLSDIGILIGDDYFNKLVHGIGHYQGIFFYNTPEGISIQGKLPRWLASHYCGTQVYSVINNNIDVYNDFLGHVMDCPHVCSNDLQELDVSRMWSLENLNIPVEEYLSTEERDAIRQVIDSAVQTNKGYQVCLPFRDDSRPHNNYNCALAQWKTLARKFEQNKDLKKHYTMVLEEYKRLDFIEKTPQNVPLSHCYVMPHFGILKASSTTTPLRIVFNASSRMRGQRSLNDTLLTGPSLTTLLIHSLHTFRQDAVVTISDISKAFHRVLLDPKDRNYASFLWSDNESLPELWRFKVVVFGITCSPYLLQQVLHLHFSKWKKPELAELFYVDNYLSSHSSFEDAKARKILIEEIMDEANMPLRDWISNNEEFNRLYATSDVVKIQKVLGVRWDLSSDAIFIGSPSKIPSEISSWIPTKRKLLSIVLSFYDPLGLVAPVFIQGKRHIQGLWEWKYDWDEVLADEHANLARNLIQDYTAVNLLTFPRQVIFERNNLHIFVDSSQLAYGAVIYVENLDDHQLRLFCSKSRVCPVRKLSIPRLELLAILLGCALLSTFKDLTRFKNIFLYSDSKVATAWISNPPRKNTFVFNRVRAIFTLLVKFSIQLKYVPTLQNPADLLTRGASVYQLQKSTMWKNGPVDWLSHQRSSINTSSESSVNSTSLVACCSILNSPNEQRRHYVHIYAISPDADFRKIHRIFLNISRILNYKFSYVELILLQEQRCYFPQLYEYLKHNSSTSADLKNLVNQLDLHLTSNNIIVTTSRTPNVQGFHNQLYYVPKTSPFVPAYVRYLHESNKHASVNIVLQLFRRDFYNSSIRAICKSVIRNCASCKRRLTESYPRPPPPDLPIQRCSFSRPMENIGMDHTSAFHVIERDGTLDKIYILLFSCMASRYIHLEVVDDMTPATTFNAIRRVIASFGSISAIFSDSHPSYKATADLIYHHTCGSLKWNFQTPHSPHKGGHFERLIRIVKRSLNLNLHKYLTKDDFCTMVKEIQSVINNRPLTYTSSDLFEEPLTPNMIVLGRPLQLNVTLPQKDVPYAIPGAKSLREQYRRRQQIFENVKSNFYTQYLESLRTRYKGSFRKSDISPKVGDICLLKTHLNAKRYSWPLCKVIQLFKGPDGVIRSVKIRTTNGELVRGPENLFPLETSQA
ncbi:MAG: reverse transcriptase domain-containing protein [Cyanobacteria bacterium J06649_11]